MIRITEAGYRRLGSIFTELQGAKKALEIILLNHELQKITKVFPCPEENRKELKLVKKSWLQWGKAQGYI